MGRTWGPCGMKMETILPEQQFKKKQYSSNPRTTVNNYYTTHLYFLSLDFKKYLVFCFGVRILLTIGRWKLVGEALGIGYKLLEFLYKSILGSLDCNKLQTRVLTIAKIILFVYLSAMFFSEGLINFLYITDKPLISHITMKWAVPGNFSINHVVW